MNKKVFIDWRWPIGYCLEKSGLPEVVEEIALFHLQGEIQPEDTERTFSLNQVIF